MAFINRINGFHARHVMSSLKCRSINCAARVSLLSFPICARDDTTLKAVGEEECSNKTPA